MNNQKQSGNGLIEVLMFILMLVLLSWFVCQESVAQDLVNEETEYWYNVADSLHQVIEEQNHNITDTHLGPTQYVKFCVLVAPWCLGATIFLCAIIMLIYKYKVLPDFKNMFFNILEKFGWKRK